MSAATMAPALGVANFGYIGLQETDGNGLQSSALEGWDDLVPTGCIRPRSMHKDYRSDWKVGLGHCNLRAKSEIGRPIKSACPITPLRKKPRWNVLVATADSGSTM